MIYIADNIATLLESHYVDLIQFPYFTWRNDLLNFKKNISNINLQLWWRNWRAILKLNSKLLYAKRESEKCRLKSMICKSFSGEGQRLWNTCTYNVFKMRHIQQGKKGKNAFLAPFHLSSAINAFTNMRINGFLLPSTQYFADCRIAWST